MINRQLAMWIALGFVLMNGVVAVWLLLKPGAASAPSSARGFIKRTYIDPQGSEVFYTIFVPFTYESGSKPPLILFLNGSGDNGDDGISHITGPCGAAIWERKASFPFIVVMPQCRKYRRWGWDTPDTQNALAIASLIAQEYGTDPDRVYLTGASAGGEAAWEIACAAPERFAALAPVSAYYELSANQAQILLNSNMPIWSFVVGGDRQKLVEAGRKAQTMLLDAGGSPRFTEVDGDVHDAWSFAYRNPALYSWFLEQTCSQNLTQKNGFVPLLKDRGHAEWMIQGDGIASVDEEVVLTCEADSPVSRVRIVTDDVYNRFELHCEFDISASELCGLAVQILPVDQVLKSLKIEVPLAEHGSGGLFEVDGRGWIQACDPVAQRGIYRRGWNDFRLLFDGQCCSASLNGWKLFDFRDATLVRYSGRIALEAPSEAAIYWRNVRVRRIP